jgi:RNA polymerase sigma-70 factor, ECF subfamily
MTFISGGEARAFDELYARYGKRMLLYFTRMLNFNKEAAEDALQDLFMKIAEAPEKFDTSRSFKTWIYTVASNACKNYYRHQKVTWQHKEEVIALTSINDQAFISAAERMDQKLFKELLYKVLGDLPPEKKEAFILKYQEEKTISEIAEIQNCPEGSVKSRLHYTIKILEAKLKMFDPQNKAYGNK